MKCERKLVKLMEFVLHDEGEDLDVSSLNGNVVEAARINEKRPAYMKVYVPDEWVLNLCTDPEVADLYLTVRIPKSSLEAYKDWEYITP